MPKVSVSLTRKASIEMPSGNWESFEVSFAIEDEVPSGTNKESFAAGLNSYVKAVVDAAMEVQMNDMRKKLLLPSPADEGSLAEEFAEEVGGEVNYNEPAKDKAPPPEEKPPLPEDYRSGGVDYNAPAKEKPPVPQEEIRTPIDDEGNELKAFKVQSLEVAETAGGDKFLKVFGGPWKRPWIPAWGEVANSLFGDVEKMDLGVIGPPWPVEALVKMGEYKGRPSPDTVVEWKRIE